MFASVQSLGKIPESNDDWNRTVIPGASAFAQFLRTMLGISSGPNALCDWIEDKSFSTPFVSILMEVRESLISSLTGGSSSDSLVVKTDLNCDNKVSAFFFGSLSSFPFTFRGATPMLSLFLDFIYFQNGLGLFSAKPSLIVLLT